MKYHFKIHKEGGGFWAECLELKGCTTQADTEKGLQKNMREALDLYLDEPEKSKVIIPLPKRSVKGENVVEIAASPRVAFAFYLRRIRLIHHLTQAQAASKIGFTGSLTTYRRLERSKTANPGWETLAQIKKAFPDFKLDEVAQL